MQIAENQYAYFHDLEQLTKAGLVAYLMVFVWGLILSTSGIDTAFNFFIHIKPCEFLLITILSINLLCFFASGIKRIHWLGEVHIWLDKRFFGFLFRSNEIILRELLIVLEPHERAIVDTFIRDEKTAIAQSIISQLGEDPAIFERLLKRGIFRSWIWYWIAIYGGFVFFLLSIISFSKLLLKSNIYSNAFFVSIGGVAILHLILIFILGYNLTIITKRIMREIVNLHYTEIISLLHSKVKTP